MVASSLPPSDVALALSIKSTPVLPFPFKIGYNRKVFTVGTDADSVKTTGLNIEILSCLPNHLAYLEDADATDILKNPAYAAIYDSINNSHLAHIIQDLETTQVNGVMFRDSVLASKIFPESMVKSSIHA